MPQLEQAVLHIALYALKAQFPNFVLCPAERHIFLSLPQNPVHLILFPLCDTKERESEKELGCHSIFHSRMLTFVLFTQCIFRLSPQLFAYVHNTGCISGSTHHSSHPHHRQLQLRSNPTQHHCHYVICGVS